MRDGGAQKTLVSITSHCLGRHFVLSILPGGIYQPLLASHGVQTFELLNYRFFSTHLCKFLKLVFFSRTLIIQGWMYHGDFLASLLYLLRRITNLNTYLFWNVRNGSLANTRSTSPTRFLRFFLSKLSYLLPHRIIYCSSDTRTIHESIGYFSSVATVIPNGVDISKFTPSHTCCNPNSFYPLTFGFLGRNDPQKGLDHLLRSISLLNIDRPLSFVFAGSGCSRLEYSSDLSIKSNIKLIYNERITPDEVPNFFHGIDIFILPSIYGEGSPNVLLEAMACSVPCICSNLPASVAMVHDHGWIYPLADDSSLADLITHISQLPPHKIIDRGDMAREHVIRNYSFASMISNYCSVYNV